MGHTIEWRRRAEDKTPEVVMYANTDLSGDVTIYLNDEYGIAQESMRVPGDAIVALVAQYIVHERISTLEQLTPQQIMQLLITEGRTG